MKLFKSINYKILNQQQYTDSESSLSTGNDYKCILSSCVRTADTVLKADPDI